MTDYADTREPGNKNMGATATSAGNDAYELRLSEGYVLVADGYSLTDAEVSLLTMKLLARGYILLDPWDCEPELVAEGTRFWVAEDKEWA